MTSSMPARTWANDGVTGISADSEAMTRGSMSRWYVGRDSQTLGGRAFSPFAPAATSRPLA